MQNQQQELAQQVPEFIQDLRFLLRAAQRDEQGIYQYPAAIEDMFTMLGVNEAIPAQPDPSFIRSLNERKFFYTRRLQAVMRRYVEGAYVDVYDYAMFNRTVHREAATLDRFDMVNANRAIFNDLVVSYDSSYLTSGNVIVKLLNYLSSMYNNNEFFETLAGRYPFKIILSVDTNLVIPQLINNQAEMKALLLNSFFRLIATADFHFRAAGVGIDYHGNNDNAGDNNINEGVDGEEDFILDRVRGSEISLLAIQYSRLALGRMMPSVLRLPTSISRSVINPNNTDSFCLIYCVIIASKIMSKEEDYKKIKNKLSLNKLENFPIIQETFNTLYNEFIELYQDEDYILITPDNLEELERIFNININVYSFLEEEDTTASPKVDIIHRSSFSNTDNANIARLLYIPYSSMKPVKATSNTVKYKLGSKTRQDYQDDITQGQFFELNDGHFCLLPTNSQLVTGEKVSDSYLCCPFCDTVYRGVKVFEEHKVSCLNFQRSKGISETTMLENPRGASQSFTKYHTLSKSPFVIYGDTETQTDADGHKLFSYMLYAKHSEDPTKDYYTTECAVTDDEVGDGMVEKFMTDLTLIRLHIKDHTNLYPELDPDEVVEFIDNNLKERCLFCKKVPLDPKTKEEDAERLVIHHNHNAPSPNIVGYLCQSCNIKESKINKSFPLVFHNLPYDLLALIKMLTVKRIQYEDFKGPVVGVLVNNNDVIANTTMKYSTLSLKQEKMVCQTEDLQIYHEYLPEIRFIDSHAFVSDSLEGIIKNIKSNSKDHKQSFPTTWSLLQKEYPNIAEELFEYSTEKGVIAYSHTNVKNMKSKTNLSQHQYKSDLDLTENFYDNIRQNNPTQYNHLMLYKKKQEKILESDYNHSNQIFNILKKQFGTKMRYKEYFMFAFLQISLNGFVIH